jgi:hypothetical protein
VTGVLNGVPGVPDGVSGVPGGVPGVPGVPDGVPCMPDGVPDDVPGVLEWCAWCAKRYAWRLRWTEIERWRWLDIGVDIPRTC